MTTTINENVYLTLMRELFYRGKDKDDRTGTGTISLFGRMLNFDLRDGSLPVVTTKKLHIPAVVHEILWYLKGVGNIQYLKDNNVKIWNEWADDAGDLGPVYGVQWRDWQTYEPIESNHNLGYGYHDFGRSIDQIDDAIRTLKTNPTSRRILVTAWNPAVLPEERIEPKLNPARGKQALPPCHYTFQLYARELTWEERIDRARILERNIGKTYTNDQTQLVSSSQSVDEVISRALDVAGVPKYELSLLLNQRSCDYFLGGAFNILSYSLILRMFCEVVNMFPGDFVWSLGDVHLYKNHLEQVEEQLGRTPYNAPLFKFKRSIQNIDDFTYDDFDFVNYQHHPAIKAPVAV